MLPGWRLNAAVQRLGRRTAEWGGPLGRVSRWRNVIRPLVKSYGDSSSDTLSPAKIRMWFFRILPEVYATIWCPLSRVTR